MFDDTFDAPANEQRQKLLVALLEHDPRDDATVAVDAAAAADAVDREIAMTHVHLPKLEEYGFVDRDRRNDDVVRGRNFEEVRPLLELLVEHDDEHPAGSQ